MKYIEAPLFEKCVKQTFDDGEKYLYFYRDSITNILSFLDKELVNYKSGRDRINTGQDAVKYQFLIHRLLNFIETTRMQFKLYADKEETEIISFMSLRKKQFMATYDMELSQLKTKKEREDFVESLISCDKDYQEKLDFSKELKYTTDVFQSEKLKLDRINETLVQFINILKKDI